MDFTREPIIETVITPKDGCKLVVRSSKSNGQEEHFVDAIEVVSFGHSFFFRSQERPKTFLVPATDYEILEVREARMVLKNVGIDRAIKIGGGREAPVRVPKEQQGDKEESNLAEGKGLGDMEAVAGQGIAEKGEGKLDKKRDRRRNARRRRGKDAGEEEATEGEATAKEELRKPKAAEGGNASLAQQVMTTSILTSLLPPPPTLISETIARYKDNALFKDAFYTKEEKAATTAEDFPVLSQPEYGSFELSEEEEEEIYQQRKKQNAYQEEKEKGEKEGEPHHEANNGLPNDNEQPEGHF